MKRIIESVRRYLGASVLILISFLVSLFYYPKKSVMLPEEAAVEAADTGDFPSVRWQTLQKLDFKTNTIHDESLKKIIDGKVKIPGFAVPLSDNLMSVSEFLLVPNQMACIHVPAPPPNLIVFVRLDKPLKIEELVGPLWVSGVLRLKNLKSVYGSSSYQMEKVKVERYIF